MSYAEGTGWGKMSYAEGGNVLGGGVRGGDVQGEMSYTHLL